MASNAFSEDIIDDHSPFELNSKNSYQGDSEYIDGRSLMHRRRQLNASIMMTLSVLYQYSTISFWNCSPT
jgi:hypothetical protein